MTDYTLLLKQTEAFIEEDPWYVPVMSNTAALIMDSLVQLNWAGFYLMREGRLVVGPFQGRPACIHIPRGKGVCGSCVEKNETLLVPDVHLFPGHIACDAASESELVIPLHSGNEIAGVLDIDSPVTDRFAEDDVRGLEQLVLLLEKGMRWDPK